MEEKTKFKNKAAFEYLNNEISRLAALASALEYWTEPKDTSDPNSCQNPTAWRLAQVLSERLEDQEFIKTMGWLLGDEAHAKDPSASMLNSFFWGG